MAKRPRSSSSKRKRDEQPARATDALKQYLYEINDYPLLTESDAATRFRQIDRLTQQHRQAMLGFPGVLWELWQYYRSVVEGSRKFSTVCHTVSRPVEDSSTEARLELAEKELSRSARSAKKRKRSQVQALKELKLQFPEMRKRFDALFADVEQLAATTGTQVKLAEGIEQQISQLIALFEAVPLKPKFIDVAFRKGVELFEASVAPNESQTSTTLPPTTLPPTKGELRRWFGCSEDFTHKRLSVVSALGAAVDSERNVIWQSNLRLVVSIAKTYSFRGFTLMDLISCGNLGLREAIIRYNPQYKTKFSTYATYWIRQAIKRGYQDEGKLVRIPAGTQEQVAKLQRLIARTQCAGDPSLELLATELGIPVKKLKLVLQAERLNEATPERGESSTPIEQMSAAHDIGDQRLVSHLGILQEKVRSVVAALDEPARTILTRRYGLDGAKAQTLKEVGLSVGLTRERIRQIQAEFVHGLSNHPALAELWDHIPC